MQHLDGPSRPSAAAENEALPENLAIEEPRDSRASAVWFAVTVEYRVGQFTLAQLRSLAPGQPLVPPMPLTPDDLLLQVNGSRLGLGSLFTLDQHWAVRITQLGAAGESI